MDDKIYKFGKKRGKESSSLNVQRIKAVKDWIVNVYD